MRFDIYADVTFIPGGWIEFGPDFFRNLPSSDKRRNTPQVAIPLVTSWSACKNREAHSHNLSPSCRANIQQGLSGPKVGSRISGYTSNQGRMRLASRYASTTIFTSTVNLSFGGRLRYRCINA